MTMLTIIAVSGPVWADEAHTQIICQVTFKEIGGPHPFKATAVLLEDHSKQLWADLNAGKYGAIAAYVAPPKPEPAAAKPGTAPKAI